MKDSKTLKYLKIVQESYKKGLITKKEWKSERKFTRKLTKTK